MPTDHDIPKLIINKVPTKAQYDQMVKNADELYLIPDDSQGLPDQTGQSGKYLKTDGTDASWESVPAGTVTSVRVQAGTGLASSQSTAQSTTLNTTISIASGYKLPTTTEWGNKQDVISDLSTIRDGASAGATAVQPGDLATVATTGAYSDLSGTPSLSTVAISGSYNDLSNKPTIPAAQVNSDWNATSGVAQILNKPTIPTVGNAEIEIQKNGTKVDSFTTNQSGNKKTINITVPTNNNELTNGAGYITSSDIPTNVSAFTNDAGYLTSHQSIKTINTSNTTAQTTSSSEAVAGSGTINLHKVSKTGSYNDLLNKPTIPTVNNAVLTIQKNGATVSTFTANSATNVTANISVPTKTSDITNDSGFITGITANNVTTALGYTPYNSTNPNGYITSADIPTIKNLNTNNTTGQTASSSESLTGSGTINLHKVSKTGSYNDLLNKPTIPAAQIQSDWNQTNSLNVDYIKNKPSLATVATSGSYNDLSNKPTIPTVNNAKLTIQKNGTEVSSFTANASANVTCNIIVPTKTSDITNDSGYITSAAIPTKLSDFTDDLGSNPVHTHSQYLTSHQTIKTLKTDNTTGQTASSGEALTGSGTINLHKVAKTGSYNDLLNKPTIPVITDTYSATSSDGMSGKAVASAISNKADKATSLSGYGITDAYTKTEIDGMVSAGMHFKGTVASYANLPTTGNKVGDMWNVTDTGANYAWDGTAWDKLSENVDLSGYVPTSRTINNKALTGNISLTASDVGALPDSTVIPQGTVKSVQVQAGTGLTSSTSTAQNTTLSTTISIASGYKLPTTTEWGNKQDKLTTQTAYTSKGSATKVPQITTNTLGQVTRITEVDITQPTVNNSSVTIQKNNTTVSTFTLNQSTNTTVNISVPTKTSDITNDSGFLTSHQSIKTLNTNNTTAQTASASETITGSGTISLHKVSKTGSYNDLLNKPTIPTVNNAVLTIQKNSATISTFSANASANVTCNIAVPTKVSELTNDSGYTTNTGTVTSVRVQAGTGLSSSTSTAQNTTLNTTISIASGYKLPTTTEWNNKQDALPAQSGNNGKFLTTNGSTMSWGSINIPTVSNATVTIQKNGTNVSSFTLNQSGNATVNISVPTTASDVGAVSTADGVTGVVAGTTADKINVTKNGSTSTITVNNVANATMASQDASGNVITATYATKTEVDDIYAVTFVDWSE